MGTGRGFHAFCGHAPLGPPIVQLSGRCLKTSLGIYRGFIIWGWVIKPLAIGDTLNLRPFF